MTDFADVLAEFRRSDRVRALAGMIAKARPEGLSLIHI